METVIIKFMKLMEMRSVRMMHLVKEFAEQYRKENHIHVELTEGSKKPRDYYIYNYHSSIYDDLVISEYDSAGRGNQILRLVNSNLKKVTDILGNILRFYNYGATEDMVGKVLELSRLLGVDGGGKKHRDPAFLQEILDRAAEMMDGPIKFFNGAGCYSLSGLKATSNYMNELKESRFALHNDNEYKIAEAFFEYLERRKREV